MNQDIRTDDMGKWSATSRNCSSFDLAAAAALSILHRTPHVRLWLQPNNRWLVIAFTPGFGTN
jgi:hypothetical protein